jgi:hypothetical protein
MYSVAKGKELVLKKRKIISYFTPFQRWCQEVGTVFEVHHACDHSGRVNGLDAGIVDQEFELLSIAEDSKDRHPMLALRV